MSRRFDFQRHFYEQRGILRYQNDEVSGEAHLIQRVLPTLLSDERPVLVDVGANTGRYSAALLHQFPGARILAFEPAPANFKELETRFGDTDAVVCRQLALGETAGTLDLYDYADRAGSSHASVYRDVMTALHKTGDVRAITITVSTLDDVLAELDVPRIDFLKIDTEGHELAVLRGAERTLRTCPPTAVQFEFNEMNVVSRIFLRDFYAVLEDYAFFRLLPNGLLPLGAYSPRNEIFQFQNILAVRRDREPDVQRFRRKLYRL